MSQQKTILYIDDSSEWTQIFHERLPAEVRLVTAPSMSQAMQVFNDLRGLSMIVIAGGGDVSVMTLFVTIVRPRFRGPMVAGHSDPAINQALLAIGCDDTVQDKSDLSAVVRRLLTDDRVSKHRRKHA